MSTDAHDYLLCVVYQNRSKVGSLELLEAWAADRGVELVLATNRPDGVCDAFADELVSIPFEAPEETVERLEGYARRRGRRPLGVLGFGEDEIPLVNSLAARFGLPGNPERSSVVSRSKLEMRRALRRAGLPEPRSVPVASFEDAAALLRSQFLSNGRGGAFLKPPLGTGSMHCASIRSPADLERIWTAYYRGSRETASADPLYHELFDGKRYYLLLEDLLGEYSLPSESVLREAFPVHELSVEAVVVDGRTYAYGITDKLLPDSRTGREHMWRTTRVPPPLRDVLASRVQQIASALHLAVGGMHVEFRLEPTSPDAADVAIDRVPVRAVVLEAAARAGGAYMQTFWKDACGFDCVAFLADQACGVAARPPEPRWLHPSIMLNLWPTATGRLVEVEGAEELAGRHPELVRDVTIYDRPGELVKLGPDAERGVGHVLIRDEGVDELRSQPEAVARSYEAIERAFLEARATVRVEARA
jgi:hypothetical protein